MRTTTDHTSEKPKRGQAIVGNLCLAINNVTSMEFASIALSEAIRELSDSLDRSLRQIARDAGIHKLLIEAGRRRGKRSPGIEMEAHVNTGTSPVRERLSEAPAYLVSSKNE